MKSTKYVVGFYFDKAGEWVALIRKNRPRWQAGLLNGIGGHVEDGEAPLAAMVREFFEETGAPVCSHEWKHFCSMSGVNNDRTGFEVEFYYAVGNPAKLNSKTDERVEVWPVGVIRAGNEKAIGNVPWLVSLALDCLKGVYPPTLVIAKY